MTERKLGVFGIAFLYAGAIMGAGFASGREIWQFFGVFGKYGFAGLAFVGALFIFVGIMTAIIARTLKTNDLGKIIVPGNSRILTAFTGYFMAFMLFTVVITMTAAGGALFMQQFGMSRILGGAFIVILVIVTVLGGFGRVAKVFGYVIPLLITVMIMVCAGVIIKGIPESGIESQMVPSPLASFWQLAAVLYLSYNILAVVPIVANAAINAKSTKHAVMGAAAGGSFLAGLALIITLALQTDAGFSQSMDMPMLAFAMGLSPVTGVIYTGVMLFAIYSSATGNYYGFTTGLKNDSKKNQKIVIIALAGFLLGLIGFRNVVAYMLPLEGFAGIAIIIMLTCNFFIVMKNKKKEEKPHMFRDFEDHNRFDFPDGVVRVTAGSGGESILFFGSEKTAVFDCGMAYCGEELAENIKEAIKQQEKKDGSARTLDYVMLSHTHYDHAGGMPYLRRCWPELIVFGAAHGKAVFERPGAIKTIRTLSIAAQKYYDRGDPEKIITEGLRVDKTVEEGDRISLGKEYITVLETKGHTDCSLSFVAEPGGLMFASESTGVLESPGVIHAAVLKNCRDSKKSLEKCRKYRAKRIVSPHYGIIPGYYNQEYWDLYEKAMEHEEMFIKGLREKGLPAEDMLNEYTKHFWREDRAKEQPIEAFRINAARIIMAYSENMDI